MATLQLVEPGPGSADAVVDELDRVLARWAELVADSGEAEDAIRVDRIGRLERLRAATAALHAAECVRFAQSRVDQQLAAGVGPDAIGRGIADQIGLACGISSFFAAKRLSTARAWWFDLPRTFGLLTEGRISERVAEIVARETRHLDGPTRRAVDAAVCSAGLADLGIKAAAASIRRHAYEADREAYVKRGRTERTHRRVSLRPAPDTMAFLTGYLPVEQGVACLAALRQRTEKLVAAGDARTRDQIMADTLVERVTGQAAATDVSAEVQIMLPVDALVDPAAVATAQLSGYGPLPTDLVRQFLADSRGQLWVRRLFTRAGESGPTIVGGDPQRRRFDGWLRRLITIRDQTCRHPFCGAPIRHHDHITRHREQGQTTLSNGQGLCEHHNYVREQPGWQTQLVHDGLAGTPHTVQVTTPTGHAYTSRAPDPP